MPSHEQSVRDLCGAGVASASLSAATEGPQTEAAPTLRLAVVAPPPPGTSSLLEQLDRAFESLREQSARDAVRALGRDQGYRLEDAAAIGLRVPADADAAPLQQWLRRRIESATALAVVRGDGPLVLAASLRGRSGRSPERQQYELDAQGRVRVEAFEIHIAEHCNLRCANCCNMSPFVATKSLTVAQVEAICARMSEALHADVIKIMGGEPLLHPQIVEMIKVLRDSGVGDRVRLFTNGLRLRAMPDEFWAALDEMTISNYSSAPVRPAILELARARSREHGFVLNIKPVTEFSRVLSPTFVPEVAAAETFDRCWLRHRCLIVRDQRFYMCTRSAYAPDFLATVEHDPVPAGVQIVREDDGVPIEGDALAERLKAYLNRRNPLGACHYCHGGDGNTVPHHQLSRSEVAGGILSRRAIEVDA